MLTAKEIGELASKDTCIRHAPMIAESSDIQSGPMRGPIEARLNETRSDFDCFAGAFAPYVARRDEAPNGS